MKTDQRIDERLEETLIARLAAFKAVPRSRFYARLANAPWQPRPRRMDNLALRFGVALAVVFGLLLIFSVVRSDPVQSTPTTTQIQQPIQPGSVAALWVSATPAPLRVVQPQAIPLPED